MTPRTALIAASSFVVLGVAIYATAHAVQRADVPSHPDEPALDGPPPEAAPLSTATGAIANRDDKADTDTNTNRPVSLRETAEPASVPIAEFGGQDRERLRFLNGIMDLEGKKKVPADARIRSADLDMFREMVDAANHDVDHALDGWRSIANKRTAQLEQQLHARLARGETEGLPYQSADNRMKRRHPYEAITQVVCEAGTFVLRAPVDENPRLKQAGEELDHAMRRRALDFETRVRPLFRTGESR
ncbi:MAG: hypothetical protein ACE37K_25190 [Planctomycetota bacterium]